ncbi:Adenine specific DNA methylase Mod [Cardiobacterium valvarum]|uniref:Adenine specific DNA methylase Mod n=2 Tax=Cardiobacterium valvarum TaxID=194702 RepID=A0A381E6A8_9GAMM|nr:Adenine specific DNA methylase Mod [Cardiobacterium valvarum]
MVSENNKLKFPVTLKAAWTQFGQMTSFFKGEKVFDSKGQLVTDFFFTSTGKLKYKKQRTSEIPSSVHNFGTASQSTNALTNILGSEPEHTPKPLKLNEFLASYFCDNKDLILDYFAGSGTTAHAVINLNREDGGKRKYILVEQGEYFDTVLKPRVQKVIYSENWKDGKPQADKDDDLHGVPQIVKVLQLESYEDTLNNLTLVRQDDVFDHLPEAAQEDYLLRYMLTHESRDSLLSTDDFKHPFAYRLNIATSSAGSYESRVIDLVETFNYLLGISVQAVDDQRHDLRRQFVFIEGRLPNGENCLIVWRDCERWDYQQLPELLKKRRINPNNHEFDVIYINGDHNIPTVLQEADGIKTLKLRPIEPEFLSLMFDVEDV